MRRLLSTFVLAIALVWPGFASASPELQAAEDAIARGEYGSAMQLLKIAANAGNPIAAETLGDMLWYGEAQYGPEVTQNHEEALAWYRRAAEQGSPFAAYVVSQIEQGIRTPPSAARTSER
jgi:TPR repeat protein